MMEPQAQPISEVGVQSFDSKGILDRYFEITSRGSTQRQEIVAGITTFLAMVYSVFVVPGMFGKAGFDTSAVFVAVCLTTAFGSLLMGVWAKLPIAIGCAISLTAFTAFGLVLVVEPLGEIEQARLVERDTLGERHAHVEVLPRVAHLRVEVALDVGRRHAGRVELLVDLLQ